MTLRKKTIIVIGAALAVLLALLFALTRSIMLNNFDALQKQAVRQDVSRAVSAVNDNINSLDKLCQSMAFKDETANYVKSPNDDYLNTNFSDGMFTDLKLNFAMVFNFKGDVMYEKAFDLGSGRSMPFPASLNTAGNVLKPYNQILASRQGETGIIITRESPMLYSIWPIMQNGTGEPGGALVMGRYFDSTLIRNLADTSNIYHLKVYKFDIAGGQADIAKILYQFNTGSVVPAQYLPGNSIGGYSYLKDINNNQALILKVDEPADVYQSGQSYADSLLILLFAGGAILMVAILLLLDRLVLSRLLSLKNQVAGITIGGQLPSRVQISGRDELSSLGETVNQMIERTELSQVALHQSEAANKLLYEQEKKQRQELEEEARARALFIDVLAHELRTPLTPVLISVETLNSVLSMEPASIQSRLAKSALNGAESLRERLEELLDLARFTRGAFKLKPQRINTLEFLKKIANQFEPALLAKKQHLEIDLSPDLPDVQADPARIEQVLVNLLSNAAKYSPDGSQIRLTASKAKSDLLIEVKDQGIGVSPEDQKNLFKPYHRVEQDRQSFSGIGLGLAVSKQIVDAHKGRIWIESERGKGSSFKFTLPLGEARPGDEPAPVAAVRAHFENLSADPSLLQATTGKETGK